MKNKVKLAVLFSNVIFNQLNDNLPSLFFFLALKKVFAENQEIQEMCQNNFIMLNLMVQRHIYETYMGGVGFTQSSVIIID